MTVQELDNRFTKVISDLQGGLSGIMVQVGSDALTMIRERVQKTGTDAEGNKYKPYSTESMLANCSSMTTSACNTIAGSKSKRRELRWVTIKKGSRNIRLFEIPGGYKEYRELHGRQTGFVDFAFTNRMWDNIKLTSDASDHAEGVAKISATTDLDNSKLAGNTAKRGDILKLSKTEVKDLSKTLNKKIAEIITKNGLK